MKTRKRDFFYVLIGIIIGSCVSRGLRNIGVINAENQSIILIIAVIVLVGLVGFSVFYYRKQNKFKRDLKNGSNN